MVSIRIVFPLVFAGQIFLTSSLMALVIYGNQRATIHKTAFEIMSNIESRFNNKLNDYLEEPSRITKLYTNELKEEQVFGLDLTKLDNTRDLALLTRSLWQLTHIFDEVSFILIVTYQGQLVSLEINNSQDYILQVGDLNKSDKLAVYKLDRQGLNSQPLYTKKITESPRLLSYYKEFVQAKKEILYRSRFEKENGEVFISSIQTIYSEHSQPLGVVSLTFNLNKLLEFLDTLKITEDDRVFIFNEQGELIARSTPSSLDTTFNNPHTQAVQKYTLMSESPDPLIRKTSDLIKKKFTSISQITTIQEVFQYNGKSNLLHLEKIDFSDSQKLYVGMIVPEDKLPVVEDIRQGIIRAAYLSAGLVIIAIILGLAISYYSILPILRLSAIAEDINQDNISDPKYIKKIEQDTKRKDEFGKLAKIFVKILQQMQRHSVILKAQIEQLRVDIDEQQKAEQVESITESELFRDLQSKARIIREQRQKKPQKSIICRTTTGRLLSCYHRLVKTTRRCSQPPDQELISC